MTGLRERERERALPGLAGDDRLVLPSDHEARDIVNDHLMRDPDRCAVDARLDFARWKPGVSCAGGYEVTLDDGQRRHVTFKTYATTKGASVGSQPQREWTADHDDATLLPVTYLSERAMFVSVYPWDRELPGLQRLSNMHRTKRMLQELDVFTGWRSRSHRSELVLLRYKPERRAVFRLDLVLVDDSDARRPERLAVRILPPSIARSLAAARSACPVQDLTPALLGCQERTGILLEEWLQVDSPAPDDFDRGPEAGAILARLHACAGSSEHSRRHTDATATLASLFAWHPALSGLAADARRPAGTGHLSWIHGDFHPDQVGYGKHGARLLDLDNLACGDPVNDIASWLADHLTESPATDLAAAAEPILAGYGQAGGRAYETGLLEAHVSWALVLRAAGCLRRLQRDAVGKATVLLDLARQLAPAGSVFP